MKIVLQNGVVVECTFSEAQALLASFTQPMTAEKAVKTAEKAREKERAKLEKKAARLERQNEVLRERKAAKEVAHLRNRHTIKDGVLRFTNTLIEEGESFLKWGTKGRYEGVNLISGMTFVLAAPIHFKPLLWSIQDICTEKDGIYTVK